jgi:hypothetical protein
VKAQRDFGNYQLGQIEPAHQQLRQKLFILFHVFPLE